MPNPYDVFSDPGSYLKFITAEKDDDFEGQNFDRKEAGRTGQNGLVSASDLKEIKNQIAECISGFANANIDGGLLVLGISKHGDVKGTHHLSEDQVNSLTNFGQLLRNQTATVKFLELPDHEGVDKTVLLIYVPYTENQICETITNRPKAWLRSGKQNLIVNDQIREQLKRDKRIVDFERTYCCPFDIDEVDQDILAEYRKSMDIKSELDDVRLLYEIGAIKKQKDELVFTNAGYLFFARNPQRELSWSYVRLMRFSVSKDSDTPQNFINLNKNFEGSIAQQIRKIRTFFRESGFFKVFQKRRPDGEGFIDDPEFPPIAVDEAIVNAIAHRDYGIQLPIECRYFTDALLVENPGRVLQRDHDVPEKFSLNDTSLNSTPRNSKLMEWLKLLRSEQGSAFVQALSEGTKRMQEEMATAGLPAPSYQTGNTRTTVTLLNNITARETVLRQIDQSSEATEYANLFPITILSAEKEPISPRSLSFQHKDFLVFLRDALSAEKWYIDRFRYARIVAHRHGQDIRIPQSVSRLLRLYPAYEFQLREYWNRFYLAVDYTLVVKSVQKMSQLLSWLDPKDFQDSRLVAKVGSWRDGKLVRCGEGQSRVYIYELDSEEWVANDNIIPDLPIDVLKGMLDHHRVDFDLPREVKQHSLALGTDSARIRAEKTVETVAEIAQSVFPLFLGDNRAFLHAEPAALSRGQQSNLLQVRTVSEPAVEFRHRETPDVRQGITTYGSYEDARKVVELVPVCVGTMREKMVSLIERLKVGKFKYRGAERTFSTSLKYHSVITVPSAESILAECQRLFEEHPDWSGNEKLDRLFLVHTPEKGYARDDENSPYFKIKRILLEKGVPCQMVDTPTLLNPDWKDLNLALNIVAKCGVTPWVLPGQIPDADFFVGLSYTQTHRRKGRRLVGYSTVFNRFGRWEFYSGNTDAFTYEDRTKYFALLTKRTLERLDLSEKPSIYFHYSARFSRDDRQAILDAARNVRPQGMFHFVSINSHHNVRLYDLRAETDGSLNRGSYVITKPNQILLSTTGYNPFRRSLGTPKPLELTVWSEFPSNVIRVDPDLRALAVQILSLTKLNWASTDSISGEPITTKYAGDIAYLTDAFLRQTGAFRLHPVLERTPWFL